MLRVLLPAAALLFASGAFAQITADAPEAQGLVGVPGFPTTGLLGIGLDDRFGGATAGAGDVNGDGYDDLIVGASGAGPSDLGQAYIYFGGPGSDAVPDVTMTGQALTLSDNESFGASVAGAGDLNGDGYADWIVGDPGYDRVVLGPGNLVDTGAAFVYFGGPLPDGAPDLVVVGASAGDALGADVAGVGDVNADGWPDLLVGAIGANGGATDSGQAYVYFGGPDMDATIDLTLTGVDTGNEFGAAVSGAGDVNADGVADLLVGARRAGVANTGAVSLFLGGASPDAVPDLVLSGGSGGAFFGTSVSGAGDVNGDGFDDFVVGAPEIVANEVYVFFGGLVLDATADLTFGGQDTFDDFGASVAGAGDLNGDGYADILVGAPVNGAAGPNAGRAYVFFGGPSADALPDIVLSPEADSGFFGGSVAGAGDLDGDGLPDVAVGAAFFNTANGSDTGAVFVYSNANTGTGIAEWTAVGEDTFDNFGTEVASVGDRNGDGFGDWLIGADGNDGAGVDRGKAYLYHGGPLADGVPDATYDFVLGGDNLGFGGSLAGVGDLDADGVPDMVVGAAGGGTGFVQFIQSSATTFTVAGEAAGDFFGASVAAAGDVNGDGHPDVIVGAPGHSSLSADRGRVYLFFGGPTLGFTPDLIIDGASSNLGAEVSGAGDLNGDGYADFMTRESAGVASGRVKVYLGGGTPSTTPALSLLGGDDMFNDEFGSALAPLGDLNGDGYHDFAVGAYKHINFNGRVYIYYGGPILDGEPDLILEGNDRYQSFFSWSLSGGKDVNGDGYPDLVVGARNDAIAGDLDAGRVYVYFGGPSMDTEPDLILDGKTHQEQFGYSVALVDDTNGDGRADILVGVRRGDEGSPDAGSAFLYRATGPASSPGLWRLADVPGDQGGVLQARWTRSDQETQGNASTYVVERSQPPGVAGYAWETLAAVPASGNTQYSLAVPTYSDMTGTNPGTTCVRVTASGDNGEAWRSMVQCAASVDNLAPSAPPAAAVSASGDGDVLVTVETLAAPPDDLAGYAVYRSADATCDAADTPLATVPDDGGPLVTLEDDATVF
ncbi:MAG: FG-GAP-like repeat-containing protein, partial [Bacteroidota bacterium]